jgi:hypothetical protein
MMSNQIRQHFRSTPCIRHLGSELSCSTKYVITSYVDFTSLFFSPHRIIITARIMECRLPLQSLLPESPPQPCLSIPPEQCNAQFQSPLFNTIPGEIRNMIFELALSEENGKKPIKSSAYYYRPDYTHFRYINTALLLTCRRVYMEARCVPLENITCRYWLGWDERAAPPSKCFKPSIPNFSLTSLEQTPSKHEQLDNLARSNGESIKQNLRGETGTGSASPDFVPVSSSCFRRCLRSRATI